MISLSQVREDLLHNGAIKNALVLKGSAPVTEIRHSLTPGLLGEPSERWLFQAIYMRMVCPPSFEMESIDIGSRRRILVYEYPTCHIAIETEVGHPENKSLQRFIRRLAVRHALDKPLMVEDATPAAVAAQAQVAVTEEPVAEAKPLVADTAPTVAPVTTDTTLH